MHSSDNNFNPDGVMHIIDMLQENSTLIEIELGSNFFPVLHPFSCFVLIVTCCDAFPDVMDGRVSQKVSRMICSPDFCVRLSRFAGHDRTQSALDIEIQEILLERKIHREIENVSAWTEQSHEGLIQHALLYLEATFGVSSWVSARTPPLSSSFRFLPPEIWGEVLSIVSNDRFSLQELLLVVDIRSGFLCMPPRISLAPNDLPLLLLIPLIEGCLRSDTWTQRRLWSMRNHIFDS